MIVSLDSTPLGVSLFFEVFWKSGVVLGTSLCVNGLLRRKSADVRRLVLSTAIVVMVVAAAVFPALPRWRETLPGWLDVQSSAATATFEPATVTARFDSERELSPSDSGSAPPLNTHSGSSRRIPLPGAISLVWFTGTALLLTRFAISLARLRRLRNISDAVSDRRIAAADRDVVLLENETIAAPATWGIFRHVILVPAGFDRLPAECREAVLCHELAHVRGNDFLMRSLAEIARALIWFQPLMWVVRRQLCEEQELACDDRVLAAGGRPSAYAKLLLEWDSRPGMDSLPAVGIAHRSCLKRRLYALLDPDMRRNTVARSGVLAAWILGLATALPLAALTFSYGSPARPAPPRTLLIAPVVQAAGSTVQVAQVQPKPAPVPSPAPKPKFDAASIRPCQPTDTGGRGGSKAGAGAGLNPNMPEGVGGYFGRSPGRLDVTCASLLTMVNVAYVEHDNPLLNSPGGLGLGGNRVKGLPQWALAARYTIHAETDDPVANGATNGLSSPATKLLFGAMLQSLLEDRFQLKLHRALDQAPMYALTVAKSGFKLKPAQEGDCTPLEKGRARKMIGANDKPDCGWVGWPVNGPNRTLLAGGITLERLAQELSELVLDRNVIDRTGIAGSYIIHLEYAPDENTRCIGPESMCAVDPNSSIPPGATIFAAIEQQLGLKLEAIKAPQEHIVVDRVERPSEN